MKMSVFVMSHYIYFFADYLKEANYHPHYQPKRGLGTADGMCGNVIQT